MEELVKNLEMATSTSRYDLVIWRFLGGVGDYDVTGAIPGTGVTAVLVGCQHQENCYAHERSVALEARA
jgi:hypothetical protein